MKRLWVSCLLILLLIGLAILHVSRLKTLTEDLIGQLESVESSIQRSNWFDAGSTLNQAFQQWDDKAFYLHTTLRHTDIDAILASFEEAKAFLASQEDIAECLAVTARLINQLELLLEAELPTIKNLL